MRYYLLIFSAIFLFSSSVAGSNPDLGAPVNSFESVGSGDTSSEIRILDRDEYVDHNVYGIGIHTGFELNLSDSETVRIEFEEDQEWAEDFIEDNPGYFGGPGHQYSQGLYRMISEEHLENHHLWYEEGYMWSEFSESGRYYLIYEGTAINPGSYEDEEGNCLIRYNGSGGNYTPVDSCVSEDNSILDIAINYYFIIGFLAVISVSISFVLFKHLKRKRVIRKINDKAEAIKSGSEGNKRELKKLYNAMEAADEDDYSRASEILEEINS